MSPRLQPMLPTEHCIIQHFFWDSQFLLTRTGRPFSCHSYEKCSYSRLLPAPSSQRECLRLLHRFPLPGERQQTLCGYSIEINDIKFGLAICYGLRFPGLFSIMVIDCEAIIVIANWPAARADHWNSF
jgi:predicted amidohydrolase